MFVFDRMGEQDKKLEILKCCFSKLGGHKIPQIEIRALVTKLD